MIKEVNLLPAQYDFVYSENRHTGLVAGFGSGKTQGGVMKIILKKIEYVGVNVAYYLPTYNLIEDIAVPRISEQLSELGLSFTVNLSKKFFEVFNGDFNIGRIIMRTMDNPSLIVGYEVGYSLIDECDVLPKRKMTTVFKQILARNRVELPNGKRNQTDVVGTPEGFKWFYDFFITNANENKTLIKAKTQDNPYLPEGYVESLSDSYTAEELQAYLNGDFVNLTSGSVYRNFNRKLNHSDRVLKENDVLHIGMDFNITNMSAVVHVIEGNKSIAIDEISKAYDTQEIIRLIKTKYPSNKITIYPDASGNSRKTSGGSDIQLLREAGFVVRNLTKNPNVKDRVTTFNVALLDSDSNRNYLVNTHVCVSYTEALEKQTYKNNEPDKTTGFDHLTDAGGYFVYSIKYTSHKPLRAKKIRLRL